jgi:hypothetical protein
MRAREELCAFGKIYARSGRFMRVREDLCAFREIYARSGRFMRVRGDLCAFGKIYARSGRFMLARYTNRKVLHTYKQSECVLTHFILISEVFTIISWENCLFNTKKKAHVLLQFSQYKACHPAVKIRLNLLSRVNW